ncbi:MAG: dynamin family protein [Streptosporangiaceae bacterium]
MAADTDIPRLLGEVAAAADELGDTEAAQRARAEAGAVTSHAARVVVVGEKKRGKSSLINSLLRRPGLMPVDADIATSVHVTVYAADSEQALVVDDAHPDGLPIPLSGIGEYAALDPDTMEIRHPGVREVSVGLPDPLLQSGLQLIDTPGVGGLVSGHAALTLAALTLADALLFVVNGSSELTSSETVFLARATERIASVVFVLTQTDKYPKWPSVLAANQALIVQHAPQFASSPWFSVSSRLRLDAVRMAAAGRAADAAALEQRSGFGPLQEALTRQIADRTTELRAANAAWVARRVLDKLTADQEQRLRSLVKDPGLIAAVQAKQAQLNECGRADAAWRRDLDREFRKLSKQTMQLYQRRLVDLQVTAERWVAEADTATATQIAHDFDAGLRALWTDLESSTRQGAMGIAARIAAELGAEGVDALDADVPYPQQLAQAPDLQLSGESRPEGLSATLSRYWPSMSGFSMTSMAGHLLFAAINPLALVAVGGAVAAILFRGGKDKAAAARARAELQRHIQATLMQARFEIPTAMQDGMEALQTEIRDTIADRMTARGRELAAAITEANRHLEESEQVLAPQRAATEQALRRLRELGSRTGQLIANPAGTG